MLGLELLSAWKNDGALVDKMKNAMKDFKFQAGRSTSTMLSTVKKFTNEITLKGGRPMYRGCPRCSNNRFDFFLNEQQKYIFKSF